MYSKFESLSEEKRKLILSASIEEFAKSGYEKASTNEIVKKAGISKGILFHYFGSKKNLYLYILDYGMDIFIERFYKEYDPSPDIFERLVERSRRKMQLAFAEPQLYHIVMNGYINTPGEVLKEVQIRYARLYSEHVPRAFEGLDYSRFRKGVDPQKAVEFLATCLEALSTRLIERYRGQLYPSDRELFEGLFDEVTDYIGFLKYGLYDREERKSP